MQTMDDFFAATDTQQRHELAAHRGFPERAGVGMNATPLSDSARKLRAFDLEFRKKARIRTHYGTPISPEAEARRMDAHNSRDPYIAPTHYGTPKPNTHRKES